MRIWWECMVPLAYSSSLTTSRIIRLIEVGLPSQWSEITKKTFRCIPGWKIVNWLIYEYILWTLQWIQTVTVFGYGLYMYPYIYKYKYIYTLPTTKLHQNVVRIDFPVSWLLCDRQISPSSNVLAKKGASFRMLSAMLGWYLNNSSAP